MHEPEPPAWVREWIRSIRKEQPMMTSEERADVAKRLRDVISDFYEREDISSNQEVVEILGIAVFMYAAWIYAVNKAMKEEKP